MGTLQESRETTQAQTAERRGRNVRKEEGNKILINMTSSKSKLAKIKIKSKSQKSLSEPEVDRTAAVHTCMHTCKK